MRPPERPCGRPLTAPSDRTRLRTPSSCARREWKAATARNAEGSRGSTATDRTIRLRQSAVGQGRSRPLSRRLPIRRSRVRGRFGAWRGPSGSWCPGRFHARIRRPWSSPPSPPRDVGRIAHVIRDFESVEIEDGSGGGLPAANAQTPPRIACQARLPAPRLLWPNSVSEVRPMPAVRRLGRLKVGCHGSQLRIPIAAITLPDAPDEREAVRLPDVQDADERQPADDGDRGDEPSGDAFARPGVLRPGGIRRLAR